MEHSKCADPSQWGQVKLVSGQTQVNYPQMYGWQDMSYQSYNGAYPVPNSGSFYNPYANYPTPTTFSFDSEIGMEYDSDLLKGENINLEETDLGVYTDKKTSKVDKIKSPFTSTCKSTSNSHQENIPSINMVVNEEIKYPDSMFKNSKTKSLSLEPIRVKRTRSVKRLECIPKIREPLSVRNTNGLSQNIDLCSNVNPFLSNLN
mmetsp:Transcript_14473/g.16188  ORF Transcript_14473/g.16188 Transcript_14473/m.16188 type:complete len:204 (+) Transcript_14473:344-955(+)